MATDTELKISVEEAPAWGRRLTITVPARRIDAEKRSATQRLASRARLPGFRKGKVPTAIMEKRFGPAIENEAVEKVIGAAYREAIEHEGLRPITQGSIEQFDYQAGQDLTFNVHLEVRPEIELERVGGFAARRPTPKASSEQVDQVLERLRDEHASWSPLAEDAAPDTGDMVTVQITPLRGEADSAPAEPRRYEIILGEGQALPPIEDAIRTLRPGGADEFSVQLPVDPEEPEGATEDHRIRVEMQAAKRAERPELTDEFAQGLGAFADLDELRARIQQDLLQEAEQEVERQIRRDLMAQVVEANRFDLPRSMVDQYLEGVLPAQEGVEEAQVQEMREQARPAAEHALKRMLIVERLAETESLHATPEEVDTRLGEIAERMGRPAPEVRGRLQKSGRLRELEEEITENKVFGYLMQLSTIEQES
jgi:trigger factor